jgi:NADPH2:quinone reductase
MKAIRVSQFGGPEVLRLETVPDPLPAPGQLLVRIRAIGVNPVDTYIRGGTYAKLPPLPYTPGLDAAGVVVATGERVYVGGSLTGTYAEFALCSPQQVHPLPDRLSFAQGAAVNVPYATAYRALFQKANAKPGETVLIHGASGGVGIAATQLAVAAGLRVIGTAGSERGLQLVREQGAHEVRDHRLTGYLDGVSANVVLEMLANVNLGKDLTVLARGGRVVVIGSRGNVEINPRDLMRSDGAALGVMLLNATPEELAAIHAALADGLANGALCPVIGAEFALADAPKAHETVMKPGAYGKIVLSVRE